MEKTNRSVTTIRKAILALMCLIIFLGMAPAGSADYSAQSRNRKVFLPHVRNGRGSSLPLMTGFMAGWPGKDTVNNVMKPLDNWITGTSGGRSTAIFGTFLTFNLAAHQVDANVALPLTEVWDAGYTPFINLPAINGDTAYDVAASDRYKTLITNWARSYKKYADGGKRFAYIAPLQEMNGDWVTYGQDPENFKRAYRRIQDIFKQEGVPAQSVKWVFAPNGWTRSGQPLFEAYYPGHDRVDVVAISAYNFGYCNGGVWEEPHVVFNNPNMQEGHYLDRLRALAPNKPIFIAQTASSSYRQPGQKNAAEKDRWLRDAYAYLAKQESVRAIIYFNENKICDWEVFTGGKGIQGYKDGINRNGYRYIKPSDLMRTDHTVR